MTAALASARDVVSSHLTSVRAICTTHGLQADSGVDLDDEDDDDSSKATPQPRQQGKPQALNAVMVQSPTPHTAFNDEADAWQDAARTLKPLGDTLRNDRLRTVLAQTELPARCVALLAASLQQPTSSSAQATQRRIDAQVQCLRILANLCIDHVENRSILLAAGAPDAIVALLESVLASPAPTSPQLLQFAPAQLTLLRTAAGALLNLALEHVGVRNALRTPRSLAVLAGLASSPRLYQLGSWLKGSGDELGFARAAAGSPREADDMQRLVEAAGTAGWAWRVLCDVCGKDEEAQQPQEEEQQQQQNDEQMQPPSTPGAIPAPIETLCAGPGLAALLQPLALFMSTLAQAGSTASPPPLPWSAEEVSDLIASDGDIVTLASELLESASLHSTSFRLRAMQAGPSPSSSPAEATPLHLLLAFLDVAEPPAAWTGTSDVLPAPEDTQGAEEARKALAQAKASVARAIVGISGDDANMSALFGAGANGAADSWFVERCTSWMGRPEREDLVSTALLCLGNLARKDSHCLALVRHAGLVASLVSLVSQADGDVKVSYGAVGLLKNLAIPPANKAPLGRAGLVRAVAKFLAPKLDGVQPLQFATVGLLKHLCAAQVENAAMLVGGSAEESALEKLLELVQRTQDVPTRMEGTRVLVNAVRAIWSAPASSSGGDVTGEARKALVRSDVATALAEMVRCSPKYPVLVNEGIFALTLIGSEARGASLVATALLEVPASEDDSEKAPRAPRRQDTADSTLSTRSEAPSPTARSLDTVYGVLARRDARMPPQFAANACALVLSLIDAAPGDEGVKTVAREVTPALRHLAEEGPSEAIAQAKAALQAVAKLA